MDEWEDVEQGMRCHVLRRGPVRAARQHECIDCGRPIYKNETTSVRVTLTIDGPWRDVVSEYSCCRRLK